MASRKYIELQEYTDENLLNELHESEVIYQNLRMDHAGKGLDNPIRLRELRRDIARINTEIRRRQINNMDATQIAKRSRIRQRRRNNK